MNDPAEEARGTVRMMLLGTAVGIAASGLLIAWATSAGIGNPVTIAMAVATVPILVGLAVAVIAALP